MWAAFKVIVAARRLTPATIPQRLLPPAIIVAVFWDMKVPPRDTSIVHSIWAMSMADVIIQVAWQDTPAVHTSIIVSTQASLPVTTTPVVWSVRNAAISAIATMPARSMAPPTWAAFQARSSLPPIPKPPITTIILATCRATVSRVPSMDMLPTYNT